MKGTNNFFPRDQSRTFQSDMPEKGKPEKLFWFGIWIIGFDGIRYVSKCLEKKRLRLFLSS